MATTHRKFARSSVSPRNVRAMTHAAGDHWVRHMVDKDVVATEFKCTAENGAPCRIHCRCLREETSREVCECDQPEMVDIGYCNPLEYLSDAPDECFRGERQTTRAGWCPIVLEWEGGYYSWDFALAGVVQ